MLQARIAEEGGFDLEHGLKTIVIESDEAMHELCGDQIAILLD